MQKKSSMQCNSHFGFATQRKSERREKKWANQVNKESNKPKTRKENEKPMRKAAIRRRERTKND